MVDIPYIDYDKEEMSLRDFLALDRTKLANERTLLSYSRTGLALSAGGLTFWKFFDELLLKVLGLVMIPIGIVVVVFGLFRFFETKNNFEKLEYENIAKQTDLDQI